MFLEGVHDGEEGAVDFGSLGEGALDSLEVAHGSLEHARGSLRGRAALESLAALGLVPLHPTHAPRLPHLPRLRFRFRSLVRSSLFAF